jgi:hypothetical protein
MELWAADENQYVEDEAEETFSFNLVSCFWRSVCFQHACTLWKQMHSSASLSTADTAARVRRRAVEHACD